MIKFFTTTPLRFKNSFAGFLFILFFYPLHTFAQPASLDPSFQTSINGTVYSSFIQPDGKIIVAGEFTSVNGTTRNHIARLNSDGTLDASFDPGVGPNATIFSASMQSSGKIIIGGAFTIVSGTIRSYIARLNTNGTLDVGFVVPSGGVDNAVVTTIVQPDDKVVIGGTFLNVSGTSRNSIARLTSNGTLDTSFNPGTGANDAIITSSLQSDGKIIVGGSFTTINGTPRFYLARINNDGSVDSGFDSGNLLNAAVLTTCIQSDGKIIAGGTFFISGGVGASKITRLNTNGTVDSGFNIGTGVNNTVSAINVQSDGKIIVGGAFNIIDNNIRNYLARLNANGNVDLTFDPQGGANNNIQTIIFQPNIGNRIIIGGGFTLYNNVTKNNIARLLTCYPNSSTFTTSACNSYTWIDGNTYTSSTNTPTHTLINSGGCDSIVTLNLTIKHSTTKTDTQIACNSYTWINGNTYTSSTNSPTHTLINSQGCDSIITLHLTINHSNSGTDVQNACDSYTWIDGNTYTSSTSSPTFMLTNAHGCDSIVTLNLTINPVPNATATDNGNATITAGGTGAFQWINCTNNSEINGATSAFFTPITNGSYAVIVDNGNCADTSNCVTINNVNLKEFNSFNAMLFPNPTNNLITISFEGNEAELTIYDPQGKLIQTSSIVSGEQVSLQNVQTGIYFFELKTENGSVVKRVVKN